jgi:hypothetical protein
MKVELITFSNKSQPDVNATMYGRNAFEKKLGEEKSDESWVRNQEDFYKRVRNVKG